MKRQRVFEKPLTLTSLVLLLFWLNTATIGAQTNGCQRFKQIPNGPVIAWSNGPIWNDPSPDFWKAQGYSLVTGIVNFSDVAVNGYVDFGAGWQFQQFAYASGYWTLECKSGPDQSEQVGP